MGLRGIHNKSAHTQLPGLVRAAAICCSVSHGQQHAACFSNHFSSEEHVLSLSQKLPQACSTSPLRSYKGLRAWWRLQACLMQQRMPMLQQTREVTLSPLHAEVPSGKGIGGLHYPPHLRMFDNPGCHHPCNISS